MNYYRATPNAECAPIPPCDPGYEGLIEGEIDPSTGLIPCTELPECAEDFYRPTLDAECIEIPPCDEGMMRYSDGLIDEATGLIICEIISPDCDANMYRPRVGAPGEDGFIPCETCNDELYFFDETYVSTGEYLTGASPFTCTTDCDCDGLRTCTFDPTRFSGS